MLLSSMPSMGKTVLSNSSIATGILTVPCLYKQHACCSHNAAHSQQSLYKLAVSHALSPPQQHDALLLSAIHFMHTRQQSQAAILQFATDPCNTGAF